MGMELRRARMKGRGRADGSAAGSATVAVGGYALSGNLRRLGVLV